jgi:hypothetical protein
MVSKVGQSQPVRISDARYAGTVITPPPPLYPGTDGRGAEAQERLAQSRTSAPPASLKTAAGQRAYIAKSGVES